MNRIKKQLSVLLVFALTFTAIMVPQVTAEAKERKTVVIYFTGTGTTKKVAKKIKKATKGTLINIQAMEPYTAEDLDWTDDYSRVTVEHESADRPAVSTVRPGISNLKKIKKAIKKADVVYIGYPIWWYDASWVVWSFLDQHKAELFGKTVIPFCTSASSSVERSVESLKAMYPDIVIDGNNAARLTSSNATEWAMNLKKN